RALLDRRDHLAVAGDRELRDKAAVQLRIVRQRLVVAVLHLVDVAPDDAADDVPVEVAARRDVAREDLGRDRLALAEVGRDVPAIAVADAGTASRTDTGTDADRAETAGAQRVLAGAAAALARAENAHASDAVGAGDRRIDELAENRLHLGAKRSA